LTRTACTRAERGADGWRATLQPDGGAACTVQRARAGQCRRALGGAVPGGSRRARHRRALRLVKGSHIVVRRMFAHEHAYIFQNPDQRIIFAIPYEGDFTLIGTTDVEHLGDPARRASAPTRCATCASRPAATSCSR
jgi:glycerol-3-phosphate dehydrogenase